MVGLVVDETTIRLEKGGSLSQPWEGQPRGPRGSRRSLGQVSRIWRPRLGVGRVSVPLARSCVRKPMLRVPGLANCLTEIRTAALSFEYETWAPRRVLSGPPGFGRLLGLPPIGLRKKTIRADPPRVSKANTTSDHWKRLS